jgi:lysophospholipase L1-like esterase
MTATLPTLKPMSKLFLWIFFALIVTFIYVLVSYIKMRPYISASKTLVENTTSYQRPLPNPQHRALFAGDSTIAGIGASHPSKSTAGLFAEAHPEYEIINVGESGLRLAEFPKTLENITGNVDVLIMQIGANDILRFTSFKKIETSAREAVQSAKQKSSRIIWLTSGNIGAVPLFPPPIQFVYAQRSKKAREIFKHIANEEGVTYIDLYTTLSEDPFKDNVGHFYADDRLHPSDAGYASWYKKIEEVLLD